MARRFWHRTIARVEKNGIGTLCKEKTPSNLWGRVEYTQNTRAVLWYSLPWVTAGVLTTGIVFVSEAARETNRKLWKPQDYKRRVSGTRSENEKVAPVPYLGQGHGILYKRICGDRDWKGIFLLWTASESKIYAMLYERGMGMECISHLQWRKKKGFGLPCVCLISRPVWRVRR